ncbi:hypothetical protein [Nocardia concava]|uniref:hypothetical protein n=1 Tax=Nocardia concava TaxID=257281 RepID=UPI0002FCD558|nr:hypothetical protein [Nocardia concava]
MTPPPEYWTPPSYLPRPPQTPSRGLKVLIVSTALSVVIAVSLAVAAGFYWKYQRDLHRKPVAQPPSWGDYFYLASSFSTVIPQQPDGKGFLGARCSAVGSIQVSPGDPVPVRQITCLDDHDVSTWFTQFANPADLKRYVDTHWARVRERETPGGSMALLRPSGPSTPYALATYDGLELDKQTLLAEASGDSFDNLYLGWWLWMQIK